MGIHHRPNRDREDLVQIGRLLRRAHAQAPHCNAWSFARFDIWSHRRAGDEQVHGKRDWQQNIRLWEAEGGELAGAVLLSSNRLRSAGCRKATVFSWSESIGANRLYADAGLQEMEKLYNWQWQAT